MKRFIVLAALLLAMAALAACSNEPAIIASPVPDLELETPDLEHETNDDEVDFGEYDLGYTLPYSYERENVIIGEDLFMQEGFGSVRGEVMEIDVHEMEYETLIFFRIDGENGDVTFVADFNTFILGDEPAVGDIITGFYPLNSLMAMIYPPQYNVDVIVNGDFLNVTVDRFNDEFISSDGMLQLNIGDDTEIILQNGDPIRLGELPNRKLVVVYDISTRSIPAITTPEKVVVLFERITFGPALLD